MYLSSTPFLHLLSEKDMVGGMVLKRMSGEEDSRGNQLTQVHLEGWPAMCTVCDDDDDMMMLYTSHRERWSPASTGWRQSSRRTSVWCSQTATDTTRPAVTSSAWPGSCRYHVVLLLAAVRVFHS